MKLGLKQGVKWWTQTKFHFSKVSYTGKSSGLYSICRLAEYDAKKVIEEWCFDKSGNLSSREWMFFENYLHW